MNYSNFKQSEDVNLKKITSHLFITHNDDMFSKFIYPSWCNNNFFNDKEFFFRVNKFN